nr:EOG090X087A [Sida crystallina]
MNLQTILQDFNPGKFVVYINLLIFVCLCSLRLDGFIEYSYWLVFTPLWIWKLMIELFASVNLLQFIFVALRLDHFIMWKWELVFIPLWFTFGLALIGLSYTLLLALVLFRSSNVSVDQRRASAQAAIGYASLVIPGLISHILLTKRLDGEIGLPYSLVSVPLLVSLTTLIFRSFSARGGNLWWCGMQKDFCLFLLSMVPSLREYGNISYQGHAADGSTERHSNNLEAAHLSPDRSLAAASDTFGFSKQKGRGTSVSKSDVRTVVPILAIDLPD